MKKVIVSVLMVLMLAACGISIADAAETTGQVATTISLANQDPDPAIAGSLVEVRFSVENVGGGATDSLIVELDPDYPFSLLPGENAVQKITVQGYQGQTDYSAKIVKYRLSVDKDATAGSYSLAVKYYVEGASAKPQKSFSIDIKSKESAEVIHIDKSMLTPGKQDSLRFTINNVGNAPLRDLTFNWENEDGIILPVGSDNTKFIKYIDVGESADIEYQVIADSNAEPGLYKLNLYLTYADSLTGEDKEIATMAGVYVGGGTDFDVALSEVANGETSFSIANIGSNPAFSVSVIIPEQKSWRVSGSNSVIIGNLNKGDYTVASFTLQQSMMNGMMNQTRGTRGPTAPGTAQLNMTGGMPQSFSEAVKIQIAYTDTMGERKIIDKEVKVSAQNMAGANGTTMMFPGRRQTTQTTSIFSQYKWYIVSAVVLIVLFIAYQMYKGKKLRDPDFKLKDLFNSKKK
jgi:hypothetical protein